jgi:hypothetical protein
MKISQLVKTAFYVFTFFVAITGCSNRLKAKSVTAAAGFPDAIEEGRKDKRYFIMKSGLNIYTITSVDLDRAKQQMTVTLDKVDSSHLVYLNNPEVRRTRARVGETPAQGEIHLYMKDSTSYTLDEPHTIALGKVDRIALLK